jgi:hypothetical protein
MGVVTKGNPVSSRGYATRIHVLAGYPDHEWSGYSHTVPTGRASGWLRVIETHLCNPPHRVGSVFFGVFVGGR